MKTYKNVQKLSCIGLFCLCTLFFGACKEEIVNQPAGTGDTPIPVINVEVESLSGAAVIRYDIADKATDYVLVQYETDPGVIYEQKASRFLDSLLIEGFPAAGDYSFKLYSVNVNEERSAPLEMKATVLAPPLHEAYESLAVVEDFGGINIRVNNENEANLIIEMITEDTVTQVPKTANVHYSKKRKINYSVRGYKNEPRTFWITMRDRWGHRSDTMKYELKPLFEEEIPLKFINHAYFLPNDIRPYGVNMTDTTTANGAWISGKQEDFIFDGKTDQKNQFGHVSPGSVLKDTAVLFSFAFEEEILLSRFRIWQRHSDDNTNYTGNGPKVFELWASNNPDPSGSLVGWTKIGRYEIVRPSGLDEGEPFTDEDKTALKEGHQFLIPTDLGKVKYIRFKMIKTWNDGRGVFVGEMKFWGNTGKNN